MFWNFFIWFSIKKLNIITLVILVDGDFKAQGRLNLNITIVFLISFKAHLLSSVFLLKQQEAHHSKKRRLSYA